MELNGQDDYFARWVQGVCAFLLLLFELTVGYFDLYGSSYGRYSYFGNGLAAGSLYLVYRCGRYAITGRDNINRDDF